MKDRAPTKEPIVRKARNGSAWAWTTDIHALFAQYGPRRHWHFMEACRKAMKDVGKEHFIEGQYTRKSGQVDDCFGIDEVGYEAMCRRMHLNALDEPRGIYQKAYRKVYDAWLKRKLSKREEPLEPAIIPDDPVALEPVKPEPEVQQGLYDKWSDRRKDRAAASKVEQEPQMLSAGPVQPFVFDDPDGDITLRVTDSDGQPWFVAADACRVLDIANSRDALSRLEEDEKGVVTTDTLGGPQTLAVVNEPGLYSLILTSRKPAAKRFKRWVMHEVLPQIRRTGRYEAAPAHPALPSDYPSALRALAASEEAKQLAEGQARVLSNQNAALSSEKAELVTKVEQQEEWVATYRRLVNADGLILPSNLALVMHIPQQEFFHRLFKAGYIYQREMPGNRKGKWLAKAEWVRKGLFDHKIYQQPMADGTDKERPQLYVTSKGVEVIAMLFGKDDSGQGRLALGMH